MPTVALALNRGGWEIRSPPEPVEAAATEKIGADENCPSFVRRVAAVDDEGWLFGEGLTLAGQLPAAAIPRSFVHSPRAGCREGKSEGGDYPGWE